MKPDTVSEELVQRLAQELAARVLAGQGAAAPRGPRSDDHILWRADLPAELNVSSETVRRWIKQGKLPKPDVDLTLQSKGWRLSTLRAAGINLP